MQEGVLESGILFQRAAHCRGHGPGPILLDPPHGHTHMFSLNHHHHAFGMQHPDQGVHDLMCQIFLDLGAAGKNLHRPGQLAQSRHLAVRQIGDVNVPPEGHRMMLAQGVKANVPLDNQPAALSVKYFAQMRFRILAQSRENLAAHPCHPIRSVQQTFPIRVLTDPVQKKTDGPANLVLVNRMRDRILAHSSNLLCFHLCRRGEGRVCRRAQVPYHLAPLV